MEFEWSLCWKMLMKVQSVEYSVRKTCTLRKMISNLTCSSGGFRGREGSYRGNRLILEILEYKLQTNFKFCKRRFNNNTYVFLRILTPFIRKCSWSATDVLHYKSILLSTLCLQYKCLQWKELSHSKYFNVNITICHKNICYKINLYSKTKYEIWKIKCNNNIFIKCY